MHVEAAGGMVCILFTDLVGWTELGDRIGDEAADVLRRNHFASVRTALSAHRGQEVKTAGDSMMATFRSVLDALHCAAAIQQTSSEDQVQVRIGVHAGEPITDEGDVFGTPVNVASRLCAAAGLGEVLLSDLTRSLVGSRGGFEFDDIGQLTLKGLRQPLQGFRLRLPAVGPQAEWAPRTPADALEKPVVGPATSAPPKVRDVVPSVPALLCPVLVGRDEELSVLSARLEQARAGQGGVVGLVAEAGVGKTRLAREVMDLARGSGMTLVAGRAVPGGSPVPYRPLTEAFLAAFRSSGPPEAPELTGFSGHLGRLVPAWRTDTAGGADESPLLLGEAVVRLLRVVGEGRGSLLVLDDLQWADSETLAVLDYLVETLRDEPVLCLFTARPLGAATDLLARIQRRDMASVIGLPRLDEAGIDRVVSECLSTEAAPPTVLSFIESHSEGNPFLIEELLAGLVASGALTFDDGRWITVDELTPTVPFSLGESIRRRLSALDATARRVLGAAAVLGRRFDWELLPGIAEVDGRAVVDALRRAVDERLVEVDGSGFKFRHALTREAILGGLLPPERRDLSRRAWPAVERAHPGLPGPWCELAAELAEASGDVVPAASRLVESARRAVASGALATAEATARRARRLAAPDRDVVIDAEEVLVQALALAGKPEQTAALGTSLLDKLTDLTAPADRRANLLIVLARAALTGGDARGAATHADQARGLISEGGLDDAVAARVEAVAAHVALESARLEEAEALARSAAARAEATGQPAVECEALEVLGRVARSRGGDSVIWFERAAALAQQNGLTGWQLRARHELVIDEWINGRVQPLRATRDFAARNGALVTVAVMDLSLADIALTAFDRTGCLEAAQRCVDISRRYGLATLPVAYLWLAGAYALAGDDAAMEAAAAEALRPDPDDPRILGDLWGRVRATRSILHDDRQQLHADLESMMEFVRVAPATTSTFPNRTLWALLHTIEDDDAGAAARAEFDSATYLVRLPFFRHTREMIEAVALGRLGDRAAATARFTAASRQLEAVTLSRGLLRYLRVRSAEAAIRDGWGEPVAWLREAEAFFAAGGYGTLARLCRARLGEAGVPVPRRGRGGSVVPFDLRALGVTSREFDVLELVAEGLSNREIADRLFLSPKTVERHVASLFDRTGIRNRRALGDFARSQTG